MAEFEPIRTERLTLREWRRADRRVFLETCNAAPVTDYLNGPTPNDRVDMAIGRIRRSQAEHGFCFWAIERRVDRRFIGYCGLKVLDDPGLPIEGELEIGWRLSADCWGRGYAVEAARGAIDWAWTNLSAPRIVSMTVPANRRSWGVMERLGMVRRADLDFDHPVFPRGHPLSHHVVYTIDRPDA